MVQVQVQGREGSFRDGDGRWLLGRLLQQKEDDGGDDDGERGDVSGGDDEAYLLQDGDPHVLILSFPLWIGFFQLFPNLSACPFDLRLSFCCLGQN